MVVTVRRSGRGTARVSIRGSRTALSGELDDAVRTLGCDAESSAGMGPCYDDHPVIAADMGYRRCGAEHGCSRSSSYDTDVDLQIDVTVMSDNGYMALNDELIDIGGDHGTDGGTDGSTVAEEPTIEVLPVHGSGRSSSVEDFLSSVRVVSDVAAGLTLDVPVFRSPPRSRSLDRSIRRGSRSIVISVRRRDRPMEAVRADLIEGVIVANGLDPIVASEFRRCAWSALNCARSVPTAAPPSIDQIAMSQGSAFEAGVAGDQRDTDGIGEQSASREVARVVGLAERVSAA